MTSTFNTNVPQIEFKKDGLVIPDSQSVLTGVLADINQAFGADLSQNLSTPQGQLATSVSAQIIDKNSQFAYTVNQFNPLYASGFFQDALGQIYFITRKGGIPTTVVVTVIGLSGTLIPAGTLVKDTNGNTYAFLNNVTIGAGGSASGTVANIVNGPIPCAAGTLTVIFQSVSGWDSITNPNDGVLGTNEETQRAFEERRFESVEKNSRGALPAIRGSVWAIPQILDVKAFSNGEETPVTISGVEILANSLYVCAYALTWNADLRNKVANAIFDKKSPGSNCTGETEISVNDDGHLYTIRFQEAAPIQIFFDIQIAQNAQLPGSIVSDIQNAIVNAFNERIGALIEANKFFAAILSVNPLIQIINVFVGIAANPNTTSYQTTIAQKPLVSKNNISVELV